MNAFTLKIQPWCSVAALIGVALAGIFELIDETTMIILIIVLAITASPASSCPLLRKRA